MKQTDNMYMYYMKVRSKWTHTNNKGMKQTNTTFNAYNYYIKQTNTHTYN